MNKRQHQNTFLLILLLSNYHGTYTISSPQKKSVQEIITFLAVTKTSPSCSFGTTTYKIPLLKTYFHLESLKKACTYFQHSPEFEEQLLKTLNQQSGHVFELEKAIQMYEETMKTQNTETLISFGQKFQCPHNAKRREIDLVVTTDFGKTWIECKNISWRNFSKLDKQQLLDQQTIVSNQKPNYENNYLLSSKQPIPEKWKIWLEEAGITFEEFRSLP